MKTHYASEFPASFQPFEAYTPKGELCEVYTKRYPQEEFKCLVNRVVEWHSWVRS